MTLKKLFAILEHVALLDFRTFSGFMFLSRVGNIDGILDTNSILKQIPLSDQNIFSTDVYKLILKII